MCPDVGYVPHLALPYPAVAHLVTGHSHQLDLGRLCVYSPQGDVFALFETSSLGSQVILSVHALMGV